MALDEPSSGAAYGPVASGVALTSLEPTFRERFPDVLDDLRSRDPVHSDRMFDRVVLTRAADVGTIATDRRLHSDPEKARPQSYMRQQLGLSGANRVSFLHMDDPDHKRIRGLVAKSFNQKSVEAMRPQVAATAAQLLDAIPADAPFDLVASYTSPLPTMVIAAMLGVDPAHQADFKRWSDALILTFNPSRTEAEKQLLHGSIVALHSYFHDAVVRRRQRRADDLISHLVAAEEDQSRLTEAEIVGACMLLLVGGNITTTDLIGNAVKALLDHPAEMAKWRSRPELTGPMIEEVLRYDPPIMTISRTAPAEGYEVAGCPVHAGQTMSGFLAAANHDPALHADPRRFDIGRTAQRHFSFGGGAHFCLGAPLARLEGQIGVSTLFDRFPGLRLSPRHEPSRKAVPTLNGYEALWVQAC